MRNKTFYLQASTLKSKVSISLTIIFSSNECTHTFAFINDFYHILACYMYIEIPSCNKLHGLFHTCRFLKGNLCFHFGTKFKLWKLYLRCFIFFLLYGFIKEIRMSSMISMSKITEIRGQPNDWFCQIESDKIHRAFRVAPSVGRKDRSCPIARAPAIIQFARLSHVHKRNLSGTSAASDRATSPFDEAY